MNTSTSTMLLSGLRDPANDRSWTEFCQRYRPLIIAFGRRLGLSPDDAQDAAQETFLAFANAYRAGRYDRAKGSLRKWLMGIAYSEIRDVRRRRFREIKRAGQQPPTSLLGQVLDDHSLSEVWEAEWHRAIVRQCMEEIRGQVEPTTLQAFELFVLQEWPAERVAAHLNITANAVFKAKHRILTKIRASYRDLQENW